MNASGLIVGLGNPGPEYRDTRHNAGFMLVERLAERWGAPWRVEKKFFARLAECRFSGRRWILCQPQTYMNASGEAVVRVATFNKVPPGQILVLVDDADLPLGTLRLKPEGSPGDITDSNLLSSIWAPGLTPASGSGSPDRNNPAGILSDTSLGVWPTRSARHGN